MGIGILFAVQLGNSFIHVQEAIPLLVGFVLLNIIEAEYFKQKEAIREYWSPKKWPQFLVAIIAGAFIAYLPMLLRVAAGEQPFSATHFFFDASPWPVLITLLIVSWEEFWFRGIIINQVEKGLGVTVTAIAIGILFMAIHAMNPKMDLLTEGPNLFAAGILLTVSYFYFRSIWVPIGLHFGNNFFGSHMVTPMPANSILGDNGYVSALVMIAMAIFLIVKMPKTSQQENPSA